jgi:hypothetical protein
MRKTIRSSNCKQWLFYGIRGRRKKSSSKRNSTKCRTNSKPRSPSIRLKCSRKMQTMRQSWQN